MRDITLVVGALDCPGMGGYFLKAEWEANGHEKFLVFSVRFVFLFVSVGSIAI